MRGRCKHDFARPEREADWAAVQRDNIALNPAAGIKVPRRVAPTHEHWTYLSLEQQHAIVNWREIPEPLRPRPARQRPQRRCSDPAHIPLAVSPLPRYAPGLPPMPRPEDAARETIAAALITAGALIQDRDAMSLDAARGVAARLLLCAPPRTVAAWRRHGRRSASQPSPSVLHYEDVDQVP